VAYYIYSRNRRYDKAKEKLKNLYNPLNALIEIRSKYFTFLKMRDKPRYEIEYYEFFLELRNIYLDQALYGTMKLKMAFHSLRLEHENEYSLVDKNNVLEEQLIEKIAHFQLNRNRDEDEKSEFEHKMEELIRIISIEQYALTKEIEVKLNDKIYEDED
jgi:hypothetical protein